MYHYFIGLSSVLLIAYSIGSITGAYYVVKLYTGKDIRKIGSGNAGATNAGRILGKKGFFLTLLIDASKVFIIMTVVRLLGKGDEWLLAASSIGLIFGHLFPMQLGLRGGKGVVVFLSSALFLSPLSMAVFALMMLASYGCTRRYTFSGFVSMASIPIAAGVLEGSMVTTFTLFLLFGIVLLSHNK
ncbi:glycerol-3-phosphate acyltransferase [Rossellomorea aquimaris]|uniref:glycerol-3-phosphate acyltransferase n=1 Tax=Rossellomorea aquimaris TaxID=189382 RepID=UPI001CD6D8D3|nr:glycerol-3-phosphate acyltransferase [Rossellomorea aquimaris]MCA1053681.1 glycerol-3-phosphate acyltransferase [Rossellomorea aquimaris]